MGVATKMNEKAANRIWPPNPLAEKAIKGGPNAVTAETLDRAEKVIADAAGDYLEWVGADLEKLRGALNDLVQSDDRHAEALQRLFDIAHDMKGQGGIFGYDLMTVISDLLCGFVERLKRDLGEAEIAALQLYVDALDVVVAKRLTGDGGPEGKRLLDGLARVSAKLA